MTGRIGSHLALSALCVLLATSLWIEMDGTGSRGRSIIGTPAHPHAPVPGPVASPVAGVSPLAAFNDIIARPLFWASRRPIAGGSAVAPSDVALLGVVLARDERLALIRHGKPPRVDRVQQGAELEGWKVVEITLSHILLERGTTRAELKRKDPHPTMPAAPIGSPKPPQPSSPRSAPAHPAG